MSYEEQVRQAEEAIAVPDRKGTADERPAPPPPAESRTRRNLIHVGGGVVFITIIGAPMNHRRAPLRRWLQPTMLHRRTPMTWWVRRRGQRVQHEGYNGKGFALERLGRGPEAMESYQATVDNYGSRSEPEIQSAVAFAMYSRAILLAADGQTDAASALFMTVIERYSTAEDEGVRLWADLASTSLSFL
jgi:hypothetical protein